MKKIISILFIICSLFSSMAYAQGGLTYSGTVIGEDGFELIGVSVAVKGTSIGVITDLDGKFRLNNIPPKSTIVFSYVGFENKEVKITESKERETIVLKQSISSLDEVVVVGRGSQRKVSVVGAITSVDPAQLQVPATSVSNMLQGRVPGIIGVTRSGEPGNNFSEFWVRGISTFGANASALILIDGVEGDLNTLDPADIESFSVLKDASATAVYGVRGANGVILITTKRGKEGKARISFTTSASILAPTKLVEQANSYEYATFYNAMNRNDGASPVFSDAVIQKFQDGTDPIRFPSIKWTDYIMGDATLQSQHNVNISGGTDKVWSFFIRCLFQK